MLVFNVGIPLFVLFLSSVHYLTTFCPFIVIILPYFCPCPIFDYFLFTKFLFLSTPGPVFVLSVPFLSSFCPLFWLWFWKKLLNKIRSSAGPNIFSFTAWSPCNWTKPGQFQDTYKSQVCPPFAQVPHWPRIWFRWTELGQILDKDIIKSNIGQSLDKIWICRASISSAPVLVGLFSCRELSNWRAITQVLEVRSMKKKWWQAFRPHFLAVPSLDNMWGSKSGA